ncbi:GNAT family N-acetyltransferase [Prevotella sp.]|jgi:L-amino acid N-acyltransferase YncA|uniref:GNAT family N-acetyltransferase n=1 Tax=Prevotella sp. TaxID=59823 RepID=UPI003DA31946
MTIRLATVDDAEELLKIYGPYVTDTAITFEYDVPTLEEFRNRIIKTLSRYPYLVAEKNGKIIGYAYAGPFKERAAYQWAVETSLYLDRSYRGNGLGRILHDALCEALRKQGILNMNACVTYTSKEDEYLTHASLKFHKRLGYTIAAHFHKCGKKFDRWYDIIWMEKHIGEHK